MSNVDVLNRVTDEKEILRRLLNEHCTLLEGLAIRDDVPVFLREVMVDRVKKTKTTLHVAE